MGNRFARNENMRANPWANPNPDRSSRSAGAVPVANDETAPVAVVYRGSAPAPAAVRQPMPAATVLLGPAGEALTPPPPPPRDAAFGIMPARATGLMQPYASERKRTMDARHDHPAWACVEITEDTGNPRWRCLGCNMHRSGSAAKETEHLLGLNGLRMCTYASADDAFKANLEKVRQSHDAKVQKKEKKNAVVAVNMAASSVVVQHQQSIAVSFSMSQSENCDAAIAELFFACNISAAVVDHPKFKAMVATLKTAPPTYKAPHRHKLLGPLLDSTTARVQQYCSSSLCRCARQLRRAAPLSYQMAGTACPGTISSTPSLATPRACFSRALSSSPPMMQKTPNLLRRSSVSAWSAMGGLPSATCCGTHVLSLELKDLGKLPEVAAIINKVGTVLSLFWGRTRWPRTKLREVIRANPRHSGKEFGLYRAKPTRFAGKFREMQRLLRVKEDLKHVVVSTEYAHHKFNARGRTVDDEGDVLDAGIGIGPRVAEIVLDENAVFGRRSRRSFTLPCQSSSYSACLTVTNRS